MTEKQEKILQAALILFAKEGFNATSTSKVAKLAGVSEGLIFRHFGSKDGLLQAILDFGAEKLKDLVIDIVLESNPKELIRKTIQLPANVNKEDFDFWKLQFKLKWELEVNSDKKMEPLHMALSNAFRKLDFESPELEANLILLYMEGISSAMLKGSNMNVNDMIQLLLKKYEL